jgi:arginine deiminase
MKSPSRLPGSGAWSVAGRVVVGVLLAAVVATCDQQGDPANLDVVENCVVPQDQIVALAGTLSAGSQAEWKAARDVIVHTPGEEVFVGVIHPDAALFEKAFSLEGARREHGQFICLLKRNGARVFRLVDVLQAGTLDADRQPVQGPALTQLREFAARSLTYDVSALPPDLQATQEPYRQDTLRSLHPDELVKIILQQPVVKLQSTSGHNTGLTATYVLDPVMNMYFMRDQVITTAKGLVVGHFNAPQREVETRIARFAYAKLGIVPIFEVSGDARLEGGDFIPAGETAFQGQGLRTNAQAVSQLLEAQAYGTPRVVVVKDPWKNQVEMHLDTYFNIVDERLAVVVADRIDIRDGSGNVVSHADPLKRLTVDVYELSSAGYQKVVADGDFQAFVEDSLGYRLIPVSPDDQLRYGLNFLSVRGRKILAIDGVSDEYKQRLASVGVDATWMDFRNLTSGFGAAHCTTQVVVRK